MTYIAVKNFGEFQHYKDRRPPWIKLYNELLDNYDFLALPETLQRHLMMIWLIASRHENRIPDDLTYLAHAIHAKGRVDFASLFASGWLTRVEQDASAVLANVGQDASKSGAKSSKNAMLETYTEETEKETTYVPDGTNGNGGKDSHPPPSAIPAVPKTRGGGLVATWDEDAVLDHYRERHPRSKPKSDKNIRCIRKALATYSVAELCEAVDGNAFDEWHREKAKHALDYVLRDNGKIDEFRAKHAKSVDDDRPILEKDPALAWRLGISGAQPPQ